MNDQDFINRFVEKQKNRISVETNSLLVAQVQFDLSQELINQLNDQIVQMNVVIDEKSVEMELRVQKQQEDADHIDKLTQSVNSMAFKINKLEQSELNVKQEISSRDSEIIRLRTDVETLGREHRHAKDSLKEVQDDYASLLGRLDEKEFLPSKTTKISEKLKK